MKRNQLLNWPFKSSNHARLNRAVALKNLAGVTIILLLLCSCGAPGSLPADAKTICTDTTNAAPPIATWFESGAVTLDGVVNPADGLNAASSPAFLLPNCGFYQWSEQMFLWLTSPAPISYGGGGGRIFASPVFYDVSPPDTNGDRTFIPHESGIFRFFDVRTAQVGAHNLQVVQDKSGILLEVIPPVIAPDGRQLVLNEAGERVEVEKMTVDNGKAFFLDSDGKVIVGAKLILPPELSETPELNALPQLKPPPLDEPHLVQLFIFDKQRFFVNLLGNVVNVEQGQAGGNHVLEAQNVGTQKGSLVYYATTVNDVFAYFLTGAKNGAITPPPTQFPTSQSDLNKIIAFASAHGKTFPDPEALAVEVKSSWVEAAGLSNLSSYITIKATIPTYDTSNPNHWSQNGQKTVQLAMVGMHVVGSTMGHPEMIWATFEHRNNTPHAGYSYINTSNAVATVVPNTAGNWLFSANNSPGPFNEPHMAFNSPDIDAIPTFTVSPSDTRREKAWGMDPGSANSNTEILSINNSVRGQLASGDVRGNYIMTGATWTPFGAIPTGSNGVGTNKLANTTMETYQQGSNCFSCHLGNMLGDNSGGLSHIYGKLKPLFP